MSFGGGGGGGGGYNSVSTSAPWQGQAKYLNPLFKSAFYGVSGLVPNPYYGETDIPAGESATKKWETPSSSEASWYSNLFSEKGEQGPGELDYYGNAQNLWEGLANVTEQYGGGKESTTDPYGSPTVARFTANEKAAQTAAANLANSRIGTNYNNSLLGKSNTTLKDIITSAKKIPYWNIDTPTISSPGTITGADISYNPNMEAASVNYNPNMEAASVNYNPAMEAASVNYNPAMEAASVNYNPNMEAANFDYKYWDDLGEMAGGNGGNPYLDDMVTAATRNLKNRYTNEILPYLNSSAEEAGADGSGAWADLRSAESQNYLNAIGDVEANLRGNAFNSQLQAQLAALGLGGEFAGKAADYTQEANRLNTQLGLQRATTEAGYEQEASQLNTQLGLQRALANAGYTQEANQSNTQLGLQRALANAGYTQEANQLNTQLGLQRATTEAGYEQEANQSNTQLGLQRATTEAGYEQEAGMQNVANALQRAIAQSGMEADINKQNALLGTSTDTQNIANIMQGITQAPDINAAGYNDIGALSATGAEQRAYNQDVINAYIQRMEQMQLEPWNRLALLSQLIGGNFGGTVTQTAQNA